MYIKKYLETKTDNNENAIKIEDKSILGVENK